MATRPEPTREAVLALIRDGVAQVDAIARLWGPLTDDEHRRVTARVRTWAKRERQAGRPVPPPLRGRDPAPLPREPDAVLDWLRANLDRASTDQVVTLMLATVHQLEKRGVDPEAAVTDAFRTSGKNVG